MSDNDKQEGKRPLSLARPGKLELKKTVASGQVRQNFSHGRSKMVNVEVRKKRTYAPDAVGKMSEIKERLLFADKDVADVSDDADERTGGDDDKTPSAAASSTLTTQEIAVRARALEDAQKTDMEASKAVAEKSSKKEKEAKKEEEKKKAVAEEEIETEEKVGAKAEKETAIEESKAPGLGEKKSSAGDSKAKPEKDKTSGAGKKPARYAKRLDRSDLRRQTPSRNMEQRRRSGKLTIDEALSGGRDERVRSLASVRRAREKQKQQLAETRETLKIVRDVVIPETIPVHELANRMAVRVNDVIKSLMKMGVMASINQAIDADTAELVVSEFGHNFRRVSEADVEDSLIGEEDGEETLVPRDPVVTVMGHVDHGKTSLLDALREADTTSGEAGGITQHIGAYQVTLASGGKITFIDTPGHAAFTEMRARGANVTDIVVLVVAADDGIMPQTVEAISHAKAANVPIIVAINKIDKPDADAGRVRTELLQHDMVLEEMGGDVLSVEVSAKERINLDKLEEVIMLQAELLDLSANPDRPAAGVVVEAKVEKGRGTVSTILVQHGTLRCGDLFVAGCESGRVKMMTSATGENIKEAGPSTPVEVLGLSGTPAAGDPVNVVKNESRARNVTEYRQRRIRDAKAVATSRGTLEEMFEKIETGEAAELPVVIKADVHGSVEAILGSMEKMATDEVKVRVLHSAVGGINKSDITLAQANSALILGFNVRANRQASEMAKAENVEIRYYSIIYNLLDDIKKILSGMLAPELNEKTLGNAEVREVFSISKVGKVAGCMVVNGMVRRGAKVRLIRDDVVIHEGSLSQLKRFKDDAKEVKEGYDCGMAFENYHDLKVGDVIECFEIEEVARNL